MFSCQNGWHVVESDGRLVYVRPLGRLRDAHRTCVYRIGPAPDDAQCRTIWCYGDKGVPWTCTACGAPIDAPEDRPRLPAPVLATLPGDWDSLSEQGRREAVDRLAEQILGALRESRGLDG